MAPPPRGDDRAGHALGLRELGAIDPRGAEALATEVALRRGERARRRETWRRRLFALAGSLLVALVAAAAYLSSRSVDHANQRAQLTRLDETAERSKHFVEERYATYQQIVAGISALFLASDHVSGPAFRDYVSSLRLARDYPGVLGVAYVKRVEATDLARFRAEASREIPYFAVRPAGDRSDYFVVRRIEPIENNRDALGFDVGSDPSRRAAALRAERTGEPVISKRVSIVQDVSASPGFLLFGPIYETRDGHHRAERANAWAGVAFTAHDFFRGIDRAAGVRARIRVVDPSEPEAPPLYVAAGFEEADPTRVSSRTIVLGDERWRVDVRRGPDFVSRAERQEGPMILYLGLATAGLSAGLAWSVLRTRRRAVALADDMTAALRRSHEELARLASQDGLTGAANRRAFDVHLEEEWSRSVRQGGPLSLVMLDVDRFKAFNDRYGHLEGDTCLRRVAEAVASVTRRAGELVARYGGEEFAMILPGSDLDEATALAEAAREAIEKLGIPHERHELGHVTASFGVATLDASTMRGVEDLLRAADEALYRAKRGGRNRVVQAPALSA